MFKKVSIIVMIIIGLMISLSGIVSGVDGVLSVPDPIGDVGKYDLDLNLVDNITLPNFDIANLTCEQTGTTVDIELTLADGGVFEKSLEDSAYAIYLITTSPYVYYMLVYTGINLSEYGIFGEIYIVDGNSTEYIADSVSADDNILSVSFKLGSSDEIAIGLSAECTKSPATGDYSYSDVAPDYSGDVVMTLTPEGGGPYESKVGQSVQLTADIEEGNPPDYNWIWIFDDLSTTLEGYNPSHTFRIPGEYTGIIYAYDGTGNWGLDEFSVTVNASSTGGNGGGNDEPGFELIVVLAAIAIAIVIFNRRRR